MRDDKLVELGWSHVGAVAWHTTPWSTHAEAHALRRAGFQVDNCSLYITTISRKGNLTMAKPCESCDNLIKALGIKKVIFTNQYGVWEK